jgi:hypothetical protein
MTFAVTYSGANDRHFCDTAIGESKIEQKFGFSLPPSSFAGQKLIVYSFIKKQDLSALFAQNSDFKSVGFFQMDQFLSKWPFLIDRQTDPNLPISHPRPREQMYLSHEHVGPPNGSPV